MIRIRAAADQLAVAQEALRSECRAAWQDGDSVRQIAQAADVNFHTAKKWVTP